MLAILLPQLSLKFGDRILDGDETLDEANVSDDAILELASAHQHAHVAGLSVSLLLSVCVFVFLFFMRSACIGMDAVLSKV